MPLQLGLLPCARAAAVVYRHMNLHLLACLPRHWVQVTTMHTCLALPASSDWSDFPEVRHNSSLCCIPLQAHPDALPWHW